LKEAGDAMLSTFVDGQKIGQGSVINLV